MFVVILKRILWIYFSVNLLFCRRHDHDNWYIIVYCTYHHVCSAFSRGYLKYCLQGYARCEKSTLPQFQWLYNGYTQCRRYDWYIILLYISCSILTMLSDLLFAWLRKMWKINFILPIVIKLFKIIVILMVSR